MKSRWPAIIAMTLATPAAAVDDYDACLALVGLDPSLAAAEAEFWARGGGGWPARHCHVQAILALGADRRAAQELTAIATEALDLPAPVRAEMFVEAGEIYLDQGNLSDTLQTIDRAQRLDPKNRAARLLTADLLAVQRDWAGAAAELGKSLADHGPDAEVLTLRATTKRKRGDLVGARSDIAWAFELLPNQPLTLLESGEIAAAIGDRDRARTDWLQVIALDPKADLADLARQKLQRLDFGQ